MKEKILEMEQYAAEYNVPIIEKESIAFIMKFIKTNNSLNKNRVAKTSDPKKIIYFLQV